MGVNTHSQSRRGTAPRLSSGSLRAWDPVVGAAPLPTVPRRRGRRARVTLSELLAALTSHVLQGTGTLSDHVTELPGTALADSSWSDRGQRLPWDIFAELMRRVLRPRVTTSHTVRDITDRWQLDSNQLLVKSQYAFRH